MEDVVDVADQRQPTRADRDTGGEIAEHGAETEQPAQRYRDHRGGQENRGLVQQFHAIAPESRVAETLTGPVPPSKQIIFPCTTNITGHPFANTHAGGYKLCSASTHQRFALPLPPD